MPSQKPLLKIIYLFVIILIFSGCQEFKRVIMGSSGYGIYHTVLEGQTLYQIARVYEVETSRLQRINKIHDPAQLQIGTRLWIPGAHRVLTVPSTDPPGDKSKTRTAKGKQRPTVAPRKGFFIWPVEGILASRFGNRRGRPHDGIDIGAPEGRAILAAAQGEVMFSGWGPTGYGKMVIVKHKNHLTTLYAHASTLWVKKGNRVRQGQKIAAIGSTGRSTGPHLHFEIRNDTHPQDPLKYLPKK